MCGFSPQFPVINIVTAVRSSTRYSLSPGPNNKLSSPVTHFGGGFGFPKRDVVWQLGKRTVGGGYRSQGDLRIESRSLGGPLLLPYILSYTTMSFRFQSYIDSFPYRDARVCTLDRMLVLDKFVLRFSTKKSCKTSGEGLSSMHFVHANGSGKFCS